MLSLNLNKGEYVTINDNIIVQVYPDGGRATLRVEAPRDIPIVRGVLKEQQGEARPEAIAAAEARNYEPKGKAIVKKLRDERYFDKKNMWQKRKNDAREALETIDRVLGDVEPPEVREIIRKRLEIIFPLTV